MLRPLLFAVASALVLGACASAPDAASTSGSSATETVVVPSVFDLGFQTADELVAAGNTPTAIQRLMQLAGDTSLTPQQTADVLYKLGQLSASPTGYDAEGAVEYYEEVLTGYATTPAAKQSAAALPGATAKVAGYVATLESVDTTRSQEFAALFNLGRHQEAIDVMVANDILPGNEELLAMYQIGYLCDDSNLTGRAYSVADRDGTTRNLRFCDFGK
ncbi:hypothetical protein [Hyphomonas sp.]|uniref:hypothetical protein n=1 Tax=Hyphomonas sp. TaxID=87 RepID=UPI00391AA544